MNDANPDEEEEAGGRHTITITYPTGEERRLGQRTTPPEAASQRPLSPAPQEIPDQRPPERTHNDAPDDEGSVVDWHSTDGEDPDNNQLLTPAATPLHAGDNSPSPTQPSSSDDQQPLAQHPAAQLDDEDLWEIHQEAPIPPDHPLAPYTGHADLPPRDPLQSVGGPSHQPDPPEPVGGSTAESSRPRRTKAKYGNEFEDGYYAKLADGKLPGQNFFSGHLIEPEPPPEPIICLTLFHLKAEHDIETSRRSDLPQNYRQARRLSNFEDHWLPAMRKQDESLLAKGVG